ncbi:protein CWC15 homolog A-like [Mytilus galloprovincialis]|uniref:protein CWC15 homolog A-like n=1 Tax=Mytilus galloprovincialis TaxID=29158 RepID=UPI003F7C6A6E
MTTAARPTFEPARGGRGKNEGDLSALSKQYSSRDLPSHTKLKYRQEGQGTSEELRSRDFRRDLDDREKNVREKRDRNRESGSSSSKRQRLEQIPASNLDADDPIDDDDDDDSSDDEDDAAELMAELQKIKKERANEKVRLDVERKAEEERIRTENILKGNPLLNKDKDKGGNFNVKRRWDDDVVFKNCAKGEEKKSAFINDTLRSEFHKKFMEKYIK